MMLKMGLKTVVPKWLLALLGVEPKELLQLGIGIDLATIIGILQGMLGDVIADILGDIYARAQLASIPSGELSHLLRDSYWF